MPRYQNTETGAVVSVPAVPAWGEWEEVSTPTTNPAGVAELVVDHDADVEPQPVEAVTAVSVPGRNASVKTWVAFMAAQGIKHPEDATRAEMREIAEKHFSE